MTLPFIRHQWNTQIIYIEYYDNHLNYEIANSALLIVYPTPIMSCSAAKNTKRKVTYTELKYMIVAGDITGLPVPLGATGFERFCPRLLSY